MEWKWDGGYVFERVVGVCVVDGSGSMLLFWLDWSVFLHLLPSFVGCVLFAFFTAAVKEKSIL
jgi:hypothetical protein